MGDDLGQLTPASEAPAMQLGSSAPSRLPLGSGGRAHVDRALPFLILCRNAEPGSLAARVAAVSPSYVLWPDASDAEALRVVETIASAGHATHPRLLLVSLYDLPRDQSLDGDFPKLEAFTTRLSASEDGAAQVAAERLTQALEAIEVDLRSCAVEPIADAWFEPGIEDLVRRLPWVSHISLGLPQIYRVPGQQAFYPQLLRELEVGVFDALLQAAHAFLATISADVPASHRALGRSSFIAAARSVDRKLLRIATSFDFLLSVSPINSEQAYEQFTASKAEQAPLFRYRPLTLDPDLAKRALYAIDLHRVEDPVLERLFAEKRRELDQQLTMLECRNTPDFRYVSLTVYGPVEPELLASARDILESVPPETNRGETIGADAIRKAAQSLITAYAKADPHFSGKVQVRKDIPAGLMVSGRTLMIAQSTKMRADRLDPLLQHEVSVHLLTCVNGDAQGLKIFRTGLAGYEGIQEGLGVFAECAVGGLTPARLRLLSARVLAVDAMVSGATFIDAFRMLRTHGLGKRMAFNVTARIYRSGGFSKDAIYLRGFKQVLDLLKSGNDLEPFWYGKIAARHVPVVGELALRGLLQRPRSIPAFLFRPDVQARIQRMRGDFALSQLI